MVMPSGNYHSSEWFSFFLTVCGVLLSKVMLLYLQLTVPETELVGPLKE